MEAAAVLAQVVHALDFVADAGRIGAEHAFFAVAHHEPLDISSGKRFACPRMPRPNAHRVREVLQFAVAVAFAGLAVHVMVVDQQFDDVAPALRISASWSALHASRPATARAM